MELRIEWIGGPRGGPRSFVVPVVATSSLYGKFAPKIYQLRRTSQISDPTILWEGTEYVSRLQLKKIKVCKGGR
jgi:hypothetical protein